MGGIRGCRTWKRRFGVAGDLKRRNFTVSEMADVAAAAAAKSEVPLLSPDAEPAYKDEVEPTPLLFFDGHCNLCNFFVSMFLKLDAGSDPVRVKLSSLQSPEVRRSRSMPPACWCVRHMRDPCVADAGRALQARAAAGGFHLARRLE